MHDTTNENAATNPTETTILGLASEAAGDRKLYPSTAEPNGARPPPRTRRARATARPASTAGPNAARLLTYPEVHRITGWALGTLYAMVSRGQLPHVRLGPRSVRFRAEDIERLIADGYREKSA